MSGRKNAVERQKRLASIDIFEQSIVATAYEGSRVRRKFIEPSDAVEIFLAAGTASGDGETEWLEYGPGVVRIGLAYNGDLIVWYVRRPKRTHIRVQVGSQKPQTLTLSCPSLLGRLVRRTGRWSGVTKLYAFTGQLKQSTKLFMPPFPNVSRGGRVCMGSVSVSEAAGRSAREYFEAAFIGTLFADHYIEQPLAAKSRYRNILDAIRKRKGRIPLSLLREEGTYGQLCR